MNVQAKEICEPKQKADKKVSKQLTLLQKIMETVDAIYKTQDLFIREIQEADETDEEVENSIQDVQEKGGAGSQIRHGEPSNVDNKANGTSSNSTGHSVLGLYPGCLNSSSRFSSLQCSGRSSDPGGLRGSNQLNGVRGLSNQIMESKVDIPQ